MSDEIIPSLSPLNHDIAEEIASHLSFVSLLYFSNTCHAARSIARKQVETRIIAMLSIFFPRNPRRLHALLREHGVVVNGTAIIHMLSSATSWEPRDLNLLAPQGHAQPITDFLLGEGCLDNGEMQMEWNFAIDASNFHEYQMPDIGNIDGKKIMILESRTPSIWPSVLFAMSSAQMDVVTPHHIISLHPYLSPNGKALCRSWSDREWYEMRGLTVIKPDDPHGPNGLWCPMRVRSMTGGRGIGLYEWNESPGASDDETSQLVKSGFDSTDGVSWQIGRMCENTSCPYFTP